ncbi:MAG: nucleoside 2-deoxyribosyltransferase [Planctomycetota bacterium]
MYIYLARPISGGSLDDVVEYYEHMREYLEQRGYRVLSPMTAKGYLRTEEKFKSSGYDGFPVSTNHAIFERDRWMIENMADIVYANLVGADKASIGCMFELAWACAKGKHTIVVMEMENVHRHAFVLEAADIVFETEHEAMVYLSYLISGELRND